MLSVAVAGQPMYIKPYQIPMVKGHLVNITAGRSSPISMLLEGNTDLGLAYNLLRPPPGRRFPAVGPLR